jgi:hypothetical protein
VPRLPCFKQQSVMRANAESGPIDKGRRFTKGVCLHLASIGPASRKHPIGGGADESADQKERRAPN